MKRFHLLNHLQNLHDGFAVTHSTYAGGRPVNRIALMSLLASAALLSTCSNSGSACGNCGSGTVCDESTGECVVKMQQGGVCVPSSVVPTATLKLPCGVRKTTIAPGTFSFSAAASTTA